MKKISLLLAVLIFLCCVAGCTASAPEQNDEKLHIVSAIFPSYDFARQICGDAVELTLLIPPGNEVHGYEPTLKDIEIVQDCDLFLYAGGDSDGWTEDILRASGNDTAVVISMLELVEAYEEEHTAGMQEDHHHHDHDHEESVEDDHGEYDEHVWTDPENAAVIAQAICDAACALDETHAVDYRENTAAYLEELHTLDRDFAEMAEHAERDLLIFAERFPFRYLTEAYGFDYDAAFSGCSSDTEPSLATIAGLMEQVKQNDAKAVFYIEFSDGKTAEMIAESTGARAMQLYSCQNVTREDFERGVTYLELMRRNLNTLEEALNG